MFRNEKEQGFTLLELVTVMTIITVLAAIALPNYYRAVVQARESVLKENLYWMRDSIDQYFLDKGKYPADLNQLVEGSYLRSIPEDPIEGSSNWIMVQEDIDEFEDPEYEPGIWDVRSRSDKRATNGTLYRSW
jgi:general secretion pathway protein G